MKPDAHQDIGGPVVDYLLKEVQYSTCDNKFFGELEKEMLVPNNINLYGRFTGAKDLKNYQVRVGLPDPTNVGYVKQPVSNIALDGMRVLTYNLSDLINYEDYWWLPLEGETEFSLQLNLLPPFPKLQTVGLDVICRPDIALGTSTEVTTTVRLEAFDDVDYVSLTLGAPAFSAPGVSMAITDYTDPPVDGPTQRVTTPSREYPFPRLSLHKGQRVEYKAITSITADPTKMNYLRCQQDLMGVKLLALSNTTPEAAPCSVSIVDGKGEEIPVKKTVRSTSMQVNAQIMYSPYSIPREKPKVAAQTTVSATAY